MSIGKNARLLGFKKLLAISGETMTYSGTSQSITCIVDYREYKDATVLRELNRQGRQVNDDRTIASVEFLQSALSSAPEVGESFTNADGRKHRINKLPRTTDFSYVCECKVYNDASNAESSS